MARKATFFSASEFTSCGRQTLKMPYFRIACFALMVIAAFHLAGHLFLIPQFQLIHNITGQLPANQTEKELLSLMNHYHKRIGGKPMSMMDIQNGLSLCYALFFFWLGSLNLLLHKPIKRNHRLLARVSFLNTLMLGLGALIAVIYFFWLPVASFLTGMVFFLVAGIQFARSKQF